ncbi:3,4-dihydroxy-2-butanone-4-phosphate synthase [Mycolicibacterium confluentis]|uniref:3,4-dihydroxy-2-butanone-4-phosphate synthase n=1 Tax=Mycolicibacterium confluentis TaxID=28047 RepID=A0A7I7Y566_9MYCO|nr:3,4-dihydroxy-2-butanone-4-phosphate synthase [Mycolicibacterium confluentis]MCV7319202.1 3,4-dihydroxy-2-butanone-4-phosphate synthase [Mycolicibacterium confluentis]ORV24912.1 hypothetical protein AWB99_05370 [Mycolicibacterium confluentis]BBZ36816.1 hypothetical protein MCNF_54210 [Mycolicibacterium confluentis]
MTTLAVHTDEPAPVSHLGADRTRLACSALERGEIVILSDGRESTLVLSAATATSKSVAQMISMGSGLVCVAMGRDRLRQLSIPKMAAEDESHASRFHVAVDAATGIGTGISAVDRARTLRLLSDPASVGADFTRPGHVIPVNGDIDSRVSPGTAELAFILVGLTKDPSPTAAYCALTSDRDPCEVAGPEEGAAFAEEHGLAFIEREDVLTAFYRQ